MDTNEALKSLIKIVGTQQKVIERLAQAQGLMPAAPAQTPMNTDMLTQKLQAVLFAKHPEMQNAFVELPVVATTDAGQKQVHFKYHAGKDGGAAVKAAVNEAATAVLGAGHFLLQGIGEF
jgi:hypothetical protein